MAKATPLWGRTTEVEIFGERLRDARLIQRLKSGDVAQRAEVSQSWYSKVEHAVTTTVENDRARLLSSALEFPIEFLSSPPVTPVQRGSLLFRAKKNLPKSEEDQLVSWARLVGDLIHAAEPKLRLPLLHIPRIAVGMPAWEAAKATRKSFEIAEDQPIPHLIRVIERGGAYVATIDFDSNLHARNHDAFSTWVGPLLDRPLVVVRAIDSWERTRMSVAHELGHLAMHYSRREGDLEREAYEFAAEFLLPSPILRREWPRSPTLLALMPIKRIWGMSLASLIEHGYRNSLLSGGQRTSLYKQMSNRRDRQTGERMRVREPGWRDREVEHPKLVAKVAETAFGKTITVEDLAKRVYSWRADFLQSLLENQVTAWARVVARSPAASSESGELAQVLPLRARFP